MLPCSDNETEGIWEEMSKDVLASYPLEPEGRDLDDILDRWPREDEDAEKPVTEEEIEKWKRERLRDAILPDVQDDEGEGRVEESQTGESAPATLGYDWQHRLNRERHKPQSYRDIEYAPKESLRELCRTKGLQVIVKMARIELTPENPDFPIGGWHVEGMSNERIAATALYYVDSENITETSLQFRTGVDEYQDDFIYRTGQDAYNWWERVYGTAFRSPSGHDPALQYWGSMETREGRLLAFPNIL